MIKYRDIEKYVADMFLGLMENDAMDFGFSDDPTNRVIVERQNGAPMPDVETVLTFRLDNYDLWEAQRQIRTSSGVDKYGNEIITELRTFTCCVNIMAKGLGNSFDAARFIIANLQNGRYNNFVRQKGRLLGIQDISTMRNLSGLENGTWTERVYFEIQMNFKEEITINNHTLFVKTPETPSDLAQSVAVTTRVIK